MRKKPTNLTLSDAIRERANRLMVMQGFTSFSAFVEQLIREEHERQFHAATPRMLDRASSTPEEKAAGDQLLGIVSTHYGKQKKPRKTGK